MRTRSLITTALSTLLLALILATALHTPSSDVQDPIYTAPSPTTTMPECTTQDGTGQAQCTSEGMVMGDCAFTNVGNAIDSCMRLHAQGQFGIDSVRECNSIRGTVEENLPGWTLEECYKANM